MTVVSADADKESNPNKVKDRICLSFIFSGGDRVIQPVKTENYEELNSFILRVFYSPVKL